MSDETNTETEQVQGEIRNLEAERMQLNPNSADDRFRILQIDERLNELRGTVKEVSAEDLAKQIHEEVQELVLSYDFNAALGHPEANKIIYTLLYGQKQKHLEELQDEKANNQEVQAALNLSMATVRTVGDEKVQLQETLAKVTADRDQLEETNAELMQETRFLRNENARLQTQLKAVEASLEMEKKRAQSFAPPSESLDALLAGAAKATQERRKVINLQPADERKSLYTATDEHGNKVEINWLELGKYEEVDHFPAPPAGDQVAEEPAADADPEVTEDDIAAQGHAVEAAAAEAARFPDVVHGDTAGQEAAAGAEEAVADDSRFAAGQAPEARLEERVAELEAWKERICSTIHGSFGIVVD